MIIRGLSIEDYHGQNEWISHSKIRAFHQRGPRYYYERFIAQTIAREESDAFVFGNTFETLYQRGADAAMECVVVKPRGLKLSTKEGMAWAAKQPKDRPVITQDEWEHMLAMSNALDDVPDLLDLLEGAEQQVTLRGEIGGLKVQARPDYLRLSDMGAYSIDLKTTKDMADLVGEDGACGPALTRLGYHTQAALVRELLRQHGYEHATTYLVIAEKVPAYRACVVDIESVLGEGDRELSIACPALARCIETNAYPRTPRGIVKLQRPRWMPEPAHP